MDPNSNSFIILGVKQLDSFSWMVYASNKVVNENLHYERPYVNQVKVMTGDRFVQHIQTEPTVFTLSATMVDIFTVTARTAEEAVGQVLKMWETPTYSEKALTFSDRADWLEKPKEWDDPSLTRDHLGRKVLVGPISSPTSSQGPSEDLPLPPSLDELPSL